MPNTEPRLEHSRSLAKDLSLFLRGGAGRREHARQSQQLLRQISLKAPQLASVLDMLNEGQTPGRVEFADEPAPAPRRRFGASALEAAAGLLRQAFAGAAPLFHGCKPFLQLNIVKKKKQA